LRPTFKKKWEASRATTAEESKRSSAWNLTEKKHAVSCGKRYPDLLHTTSKGAMLCLKKLHIYNRTNNMRMPTELSGRGIGPDSLETFLLPRAPN